MEIIAPKTAYVSTFRQARNLVDLAPSTVTHRVGEVGRECFSGDSGCSFNVRAYIHGKWGPVLRVFLTMQGVYGFVRRYTRPQPIATSCLIVLPFGRRSSLLTMTSAIDVHACKGRRLMRLSLPSALPRFGQHGLKPQARGLREHNVCLGVLPEAIKCPVIYVRSIRHSRCAARASGSSISTLSVLVSTAHAGLFVDHHSSWNSFARRSSMISRITPRLPSASTMLSSHSSRFPPLVILIRA